MLIVYLALRAISVLLDLFLHHLVPSVISINWNEDLALVTALHALPDIIVQLQQFSLLLVPQEHTHLPSDNLLALPARHVLPEHIAPTLA